MKLQEVLNALSTLSDVERKIAKQHLINLSLSQAQSKKESAKELQQFKAKFKRRFKS